VLNSCQTSAVLDNQNELVSFSLIFLSAQLIALGEKSLHTQIDPWLMQPQGACQQQYSLQISPHLILKTHDC
jgi:hypothetical protein